jgi:hypothetical protein
MPRPSHRPPVQARWTPEHAALRVVFEALEREDRRLRSSQPRIRLPMMEDAHRHEVVHRVVAAQSRRHDVMNLEPGRRAADHAAIAVPSPDRRTRPFPLGALELGAGGTAARGHVFSLRFTFLYLRGRKRREISRRATRHSHKEVLGQSRQRAELHLSRARRGRRHHLRILDPRVHLPGKSDVIAASGENAESTPTAAAPGEEGRRREQSEGWLRSSLTR